MVTVKDILAIRKIMDSLPAPKFATPMNLKHPKKPKPPRPKR